MNSIYISLVISLFSMLSSLIGNILLFIPYKYKDYILCGSLGLSFGVMILISLFELIPEGINYVYSSFSIIYLFIISLLLLLVGYLIVKVFNSKLVNRYDNLYVIGFLSFLVMFLHNFPEGLISYLSCIKSLKLGLKIGLMIMIHNIPEGICIALPIYYSTQSKLKALSLTILSGLGEMSGVVVGYMFFRSGVSNYIMYYILMITAGIMISLALLKLLREGLSLNKNKYFILGVIVSIILFLITLS